MKLEFDIGEITQEHLVDAMASKLLTTYGTDEDGSSYPRHSELAERLGKAIKVRIDEIAEQHVRAMFDDAIKARIAAAVDEVLADGWVKTDGYGNKNGERIDLKGRINEIITEKKSTGYNREAYTLSEKLVSEKVREVFTDKFNREVADAQKALREQLDAVVAAKFTETLKSALGVR